MAYQGWLSLGQGTELINHARVTTYLRTLKTGVQTTGTICGTLEAFLDATYDTPTADDAPWFDGVGQPNSAEFAGMLVTSITGLDAASMSRTVTQNAGDGGAVGRIRRGTLTIVVNGWLYGSTCCGVASGLRWLARALAEPDCPDGTISGCNGTDLCFMECCPSVDDPDTSPYADVLRTLHGVTCTDGPVVLARAGNSCGACGFSERLNVEFTLTATDPYAYRAQTNLITDEVFGASGGVCVVWSTDPDDCAACVAPESPLLDPAADTRIPPKLPRIIPSLGGCVALSNNQFCLPIADDLIPTWAEGVPVVTITADPTNVLRNIIVGFAPVADDSDCSRLEACDFTYRYAIQYIPAGGTLVVDSARHTAVITVGGISYDATGMLMGLDGKPFEWPVLCCGAYCMCIDWPSDAEFGVIGTLTADLVIREA